MNNSFPLSAVETLIQEARKLVPDFSSKGSRIATDHEVHKAPDLVGQLLARKKLLQVQEAKAETEREAKALRAVQSLCEHMAAYEFSDSITGLACSQDMVIRNDGMVVIKTQSLPSLERREAIAAE